ncbi:MAG: hypothetical protein ACFB0B_03755 [Thermonemataceae bacterium]
MANTSFSQKTEERLQYLKQTPPSSTPEIFAPDLISDKNEYEFGSVFNKEATEFFYGVDINGRAEIRYSKLVGNEWSKPTVLLSDEEYGYNDPFLSPDEKRLYFISKKALDGPGAKEDYDIWYVERKKKGWSEPINAGPNINSARDEYYISFSQTGTMYFSSNVQAPKERKYDFDIYASKSIDGEFQKAVLLSESINTPSYEADVFIDPKESYIIFCANREEGLGEGDLYISFKQSDGSWTKSKNMGKAINSDKHELCPFVSKDGKYFFYTSNKDIYWVSTAIIDELKK